MSNIQIIGDTLRSTKTLKRLGLALGLDINKEAHQKTIQEYGASVLMEIEKSMSDPKKDLSRCTPDSIVQCMIDSAKFKIKIDGRQHAHLVKYGNNATLQIGYRGFIAKIREVIPSSDVNAFPVYEGDDLTISSENGFDTYTHKRGNPFASEKDLNGVVGVLYYQKEGREFQRVVAMSLEEINKVKGCAKQSFIWDKWFVEKAKVAVIKRMCKVTFAEISSIQELVDYDNRENFEFEDKPKIDETAQLDEFTQKALADKSNEDIDGDAETVDEESQSPETTNENNDADGDAPEQSQEKTNTTDNIDPAIDETSGGQYDPEKGEPVEKPTQGDMLNG